MTTKITEQNISNLANAGVQWQSVFTGDGSTGLTAVAGRGYFIDTTSGTVEVTLPASPSAGDVVVLKDYARTWGTNNVTLASTLMDGATDVNTFSTTGQTVTLVYMDGTKGWSLINEDTTSKLETPPTFTSATGGTITTSGDFKIHTFTGDGCFVVSTIGNSPVVPTGGPSNVDYLVVAGGGGGNSDWGGGGGAGGFRESSGTSSGCYTASPLGACVAALPVSVTTYPVTVGGGGAGGAAGPVSGPGANGNPGSNSVFSTITSTGGGKGGGEPDGSGSGGSGGGGRYGATGGSGNTPPVSPSQGNNGGTGNPNPAVADGGGGGGATATGSAGGSGCTGGPGGAGATTSISASPVAYAGGGGGVGGPGRSGGTGGTGGGGNGGQYNCTAGINGTTNRGGGGGGSGAQEGTPSTAAGSGGKGIVIIRYKYQ